MDVDGYVGKETYMSDGDNNIKKRSMAGPGAGMSFLANELASLFPDGQQSVCVIDAGPSYSKLCEKPTTQTLDGDVENGNKP